jgi:hypothetical protein
VGSVAMLHVPSLSHTYWQQNAQAAQLDTTLQREHEVRLTASTPLLKRLNFLQFVIAQQTIWLRGFGPRVTAQRHVASRSAASSEPYFAQNIAGKFDGSPVRFAV